MNSQQRFLERNIFTVILGNTILGPLFLENNPTGMLTLH